MPCQPVRLNPLQWHGHASLSDKLTTEELEERWTDPVATASIAKSCEFVDCEKTRVAGRARRS